MKKLLIFSVLLCFVFAMAIPRVVVEAADIFYLESELKETQRHYNEINTEIMKMQGFINQWQKDRAALAEMVKELDNFASKMASMNQKNAVKMIFTLGRATYKAGKDAAELGVAVMTGGASAVANWVLGQIADEAGEALGTAGGAPYYTQKMQPFRSEASKANPHVQEIRKILNTDIPDMKLLLQQSEGITLETDEATVMAKLRLLQEKARQAQPPIFAMIRTGDAIEREFKGKIAEMLPELEKLQNKQSDLTLRLKEAHDQQIAEIADNKAGNVPKVQYSVPVVTPPVNTDPYAAAQEQQQKALAIIAARYPEQLAKQLELTEKYNEKLREAASILSKHSYYKYITNTVAPDEAQIKADLSRQSIQELASSLKGAQDWLTMLDNMERDVKTAQTLYAEAAEIAPKLQEPRMRIAELISLARENYVQYNFGDYGPGVYPGRPDDVKRETQTAVRAAVSADAEANDVLAAVDKHRRSINLLLPLAPKLAGAKIALAAKTLEAAAEDLTNADNAYSQMTGAVATYRRLVAESGHSYARSAALSEYYYDPAARTVTPTLDLQFNAGSLKAKLEADLNKGDLASFDKTAAAYEKLQSEYKTLNRKFVIGQSHARYYTQSGFDKAYSGLTYIDYGFSIPIFPALNRLQTLEKQIYPMMMGPCRLIKLGVWDNLTELPPLTYEMKESPVYKLYLAEKDLLQNGKAWLGLTLAAFNSKVGAVEQALADASKASAGGDLVRGAIMRISNAASNLTAEYAQVHAKPAESPKLPVVTPPTTTGVKNDPKSPVAPVLPVNYAELVRANLAALTAAYQKEELREFMQHVSSDFVGDDYVLDRALRRDFKLFDNIKLQLSINSVTIDPRGRAQVLVNYNRTVTAQNDGKLYTDKGSTQFTFHLQDNKIKLYDMKYPIIFGVSQASLLTTGEVRTSDTEKVLAVSTKGEVKVVPYNEAKASSEQTSVKKGSNVRLRSTVSFGGVGGHVWSLQGWSFADNRRTTSDSFAVVDGDFNLQMNYLTLRAGVTFQKVSSFSLTEVPADGYTESGMLPANGALSDKGVYALKIGSGAAARYALIEIISFTGGWVGNQEVMEMYFNYKYQPSGSRTF